MRKLLSLCVVVLLGVTIYLDVEKMQGHIYNNSTWCNTTVIVQRSIGTVTIYSDDGKVEKMSIVTFIKLYGDVTLKAVLDSKGIILPVPDEGGAKEIPKIPG